jgi:hypothetical protein
LLEQSASSKDTKAVGPQSERDCNTCIMFDGFLSVREGYTRVIQIVVNISDYRAFFSHQLLSKICSMRSKAIIVDAWLNIVLKLVPISVDRL